MKTALAFIVTIFLALLFPREALAVITLNSATLNGASSVTVAPGASITATMNVTISGGSNWQSSTWNITGANCVDHPNHTSAGTYSESFLITAPSTPGTYNASFVAYANNTCTSGSSGTLTLTNGVNVVASTPTPPTPTPGPGATSTPTSAPGTTATPTSAPTTSTGPIYYPTINLTRSGGLAFTGTASLEQGTIELVEYSLDGSTWLAANPTDGKFDEKSEDFAFTPNQRFTPGTYTVLARAKSVAQVTTQESSYARVTFEVTPPTVSVNNFSPNPTKNTNPIISGIARSNFANITRVEISIDGGDTWLPAILSATQFRLTYSNLEDGNYEVLARAFDSFGNTAISTPKTLIIDTLPPVIGGNSISVGPLTLSPSEHGTIETVAGTEINLGVSLRGGVTTGSIVAGEKSFPLVNLKGTNLWTASLIFENSMQGTLSIEAQDGAGNISQRKINNINVQAPGRIYQAENNSAVAGASISLYYYDIISQSWVLWNGESFGQDNPQKTSDQGEYSFLVPAGKYYLEVKSGQYKTVRSDIFEITIPSALNFDFPLAPKPQLKITLPVIGEVVFPLPSFEPPQTIVIPAKKEIQEALDNKVGQMAPKINGVVLKTSQKHLVTFLSAWSTRAGEQIPILDAANKEIGTDTTITGIFLQDTSGEVAALTKRGNYTFAAIADKDGFSGQDYQVTTLPQHFFIDTKGVIREVSNNVLTKEEILEKLTHLN